VSRQVELERAAVRAKRLYVSAGFQKAYRAGARARLDGLDVSACPYRRRPGGGWQAWRAAWTRGWTSVDDMMVER